MSGGSVVATVLPTRSSSLACRSGEQQNQGGVSNSAQILQYVQRRSEEA
jgi:hypothetical protein